MNPQIQTTNKILLFIAGELAILNSAQHLKNETNKIIVQNLDDLAKEVLRNGLENK